MENLVTALTVAIQAGEVLTIKYHGGSQPGAERQIAPIDIEGSLVRARCYASNAVKLFRINKIELCSSHVPQGAAVWNPLKLPIKPTRQYESLENVHAAHEQKFKEQGWHVELTSENLSLHRVRKNGNPLKGSDVSISYYEWIVDSYIEVNEDGEILEISSPPRKSTKPYSVRGKNYSGVAFSILDSAAEQFLRLASELAPNQ